MKRIVLLFVTVVAISSCAPTIALYDQYAYTQSTSAKVDALNVMGMATENYSSHQKDVTALTTELQKLYEYDKGRAKNQLTIKQWDIVMDSTGHLLGGFLKMWQTKGTLSTTFINDNKSNVALAFDQIIKLELSKNKSK
jgi:hypothetical protein